MRWTWRSGFVKRTTREANPAFQFALRLALGAAKRRAVIRAELERQRAERVEDARPPDFARQSGPS